MKKLFQYVNFARRSALAGLAFTAFSGCNQSDLRTRVEDLESRQTATIEKPAPAATLPPNAAPIRYSLVPDEQQEKSIQDVLQQASTAPLVSFFAGPLKNGKVTITALGRVSETGEKWLQSQGFKRSKLDAWQKDVAPADLTPLEHSTFEALPEAEKVLEILLYAARKEHAGIPYFLNDTPVAGRLVYTGNGLDCAFTDNPASPELFVDLGVAPIERNLPGQPPDLSRSFVRGGRIIVENGRLYFSGHLGFSLVSKVVPANATHLLLNPDGVVTAYDSSGQATELGRLAIVRVTKFKKVSGGYNFETTAPLNELTQKSGRKPLQTGYVDFEFDATFSRVRYAVGWRNGLKSLQSLLATTITKLSENSNDSDTLPLIVHTPLPKTTEHLKALKIPVEKTNDRTTIGNESEESAVADALVMVLQGLRRRMAIHEENLRNAGKTRDAEGHLNAYRRKTVSIGPQGNIVEGVDKSDLPKNYKPGDPDAGPDGFVMLSNVNKAVESAEFKATIDEYKLVRTALERLAPKHVFPDPPAAP